MELRNMKEPNKFALLNVSFAELKALKDGCLQAGKAGSPHALKVGQKLAKLMENVSL